MTRLRAARVEDVPIPELSGLVLAGGVLLAIGDKRSVLARAVLGDEPLTWTGVDLGPAGFGEGDAQLEGVAVAGDGTILLLREDPAVVAALDPDDGYAGTTTLAGDEFLEPSSSAGEGLLVLRDRRLLVAHEKDPPLLVEFGPLRRRRRRRRGGLLLHRR